MPTMYDVPVNALLEELAKELKQIKEIKPPEWSVYVKTGMNKERPPAREDWWYIRSAAVLRSVGKLGPVGVQKLRTKYGGRKGRGYKTEHFYKGSGNIIRKILQQLESAGLLKKADSAGAVHKGRIITPKGISLIDKTALKLYKEKAKSKPRPAEGAKEAPKELKKDSRNPEKAEQKNE